jgi:hypothetical protein
VTLLAFPVGQSIKLNLKIIPKVVSHLNAMLSWPPPQRFSFWLQPWKASRVGLVQDLIFKRRKIRLINRLQCRLQTC